MPPVVFIDGEVLPAEQAVVPVFDRGFLYGDSVFEVLRTYDGVPFGLAPHLERLARSAALLGMDGELPGPGTLAEAVRRTTEASACPDAYVRIIVTRGGGPLSLDPAAADHPRVIVLVKEVAPPPSEAYERGIEVAIVGVVRNPKGALDPRAKTGNYLNNILALREARSRGAAEAIMCNVAGRLSEGASSNLFVVRGGGLHTPPLGAGILEGITRRFVLDLARAAGLSAAEDDLTPDDLRRADEAFITSSIREVLPVVACDGAPIGAGAPGPVTRRLHAAYRAEVARATASAGAL